MVSGINSVVAHRIGYAATWERARICYGPKKTYMYQQAEVSLQHWKHFFILTSEISNEMLP